MGLLPCILYARGDAHACNPLVQRAHGVDAADRATNGVCAGQGVGTGRVNVTGGHLMRARPAWCKQEKGLRNGTKNARACRRSWACQAPPGSLQCVPRPFEGRQQQPAAVL